MSAAAASSSSSSLLDGALGALPVGHSLRLLKPSKKLEARADAAGRVAPPVDLLARLSAFLPRLAAANTELQQRIAAEGASAFDIEHVEDGDERYIEMNVAITEQAPEGLDSDDDDSSSDSDAEGAGGCDSGGEARGGAGDSNSNAAAASSAAAACSAGAAAPRPKRRRGASPPCGGAADGDDAVIDAAALASSPSSSPAAAGAAAAAAAAASAAPLPALRWLPAVAAAPRHGGRRVGGRAGRGGGPLIAELGGGEGDG